MSLPFDELFRKKLQKLPHFVKKHEKSWIWPKLFYFWNKLPWLFRFDEVLRKKLQKVPPKGRKIIDFVKTCNFPKKLPCFELSLNIKAKSCKKLFLPWESTKNYEFGQIFATFRINFHVFAFRWTFKEKVAKSASFRGKRRKIVDLAGIIQLLGQPPMSLPFDELFRKKLAKVPRFVRKHEKSSIWPKLCNFSSKLPCFGISLKFLAKSYKKCLISWKSTGNRRFCQNLQLFEQTTMFWQFDEQSSKKLQKSCSCREKARKIIDWAKTCNFFEKTTMFWHFHEVFSKKLQKVPRLVKMHEKSSIWPKLWNFSNELPRPCISMNFSGKSCKKCLISWKSTKNHRFDENLQVFRTNYHVLAFRWTFYHKVAKSASFREKARKIIDLTKTLQVFEQTTMFMHFDELFRKELQKVPDFVKKHENSLIWPKLSNLWNELQCLCISITFSA